MSAARGSPEVVDAGEPTIEALEKYGRVPIRYEVQSVYDVVVKGAGLGGIDFVERRLEEPWTKDYDTEQDEGPTRWARRWDVSNWGLLNATMDGRKAGGAVLAYDTDGVFMLEGRTDLVVMWDLRVHPDLRGQGVGSALFARATNWARARDCRYLKVESQNVNVPACRFYVKQGCTLGSVNRFAYPELPDEVELIWYREL